MIRNIKKILDKKYIKKILDKKRDFYFPFLKDKKITKIEIEQISPFWAENTCLIRYKIFFSNSILKIIRGSAKIDSSRKKSFQLIKYFYEHGFDQGKFQVPKPLDYIDETGLVLYEEAKGVSFSSILEKNKYSLKIFKDCAELIFKIHSHPLRNIKIKNKATIFSLIDYTETFKKIKKIMPELSYLILPLEKINFIEDLENGSSFIHADFYPGNIIIEKNKITLIDFDKAGAGSILYDLACFYSSFEFPKSIWPLNIPLEKRIKLQKIFLKAYCQLAGIDYFETTKKLTKFLIKLFLNALNYHTGLAYNFWKIVKKDPKKMYLLKIKSLLEKINAYTIKIK